MPFKFGNKSYWEKISKIGKILAFFSIGKQPVFGCTIGKIKSLAEQTSLCLIWLETTKDRFSHDVAQIRHEITL